MSGNCSSSSGAAGWRGAVTGRRGAAATAGLLFLATLVLGWLDLTPTRAPVADEAWYLQKALQIHDGRAGMFTTGVMPAYPLYMAAVLAVDRDALRTARCLAEKPPAADACAIDLAGILWPQVVFLALAVGAAGWLLFCYLGGVVPAAVGSAFLLLSGPPLAFANQYLTEALSFPLFLIFSAIPIAAVRRRTLALAVASGLLMAALALTRSSFLFGILPLIAVFVLGPRAEGGQRRAVSTAVAAAVFAVVIGSFLVQSHRVAGQAIPTTNKVVLVTRVAYNDLSPREWLAGWVFWLPRIGDRLADQLIPPEYVERLKFYGKDSIYSKVRHDLMVEYRENGGGNWLLKEKILGDLGWHSAVTLLMAWRAAFIGGVWGAFGILGMFLAVVLPATRPYLGPLLIISAVPVFTLGLQAFTAPPIERYNIFLLLPMSASLGLLGAAALRRIR
ncbi:MAG: hypothetical protein CMM77_08465 [Rhodospirillaceae bacterium]|nr:hypothetical protein [Rhodospirillaceae bacterium]